MEGRGGSRRTARDDDNVQAATTEKASSEIKSLQAATELRRDSWLEKEELNRRVEEFIKKFNDEMRLQHQRSMQQYVDMINRGCA
ncbi:uncharacterized protein LOC122018975 [Zingiber officinale]|uniref:uncharacterized protein LOC122018975 n=1 Tax=Zingiber officinale TaxID=94328 RepID=UPI001C4DA7E6|nr:uncharacterized protein LOC122018975 [Zingiber officinale]